MDTAVSGQLMFVFHNGFNLPSEWRIRPALSMVVAAFGDVPQVVNHTGTEEGTSFVVPGHAPGVAGSFGEQLKISGFGVDTEQCTSEAVLFSPILHMAEVEHAVDAIQPTIWPPGQRIRQFMGVGSAEASNHDFRFIRFSVAVCVLHKQNVRRVGHPHSAMPHGNAAGNVQSFGENGYGFRCAVAVFVFQHFDSVATRPWFASRILKTFCHPHPPPFVERHGHGVHNVGFCGHQFHLKPFRHHHFLDSFLWRSGWTRRFLLTTGNEIFCLQQGTCETPTAYQPHAQ